MIKYFVLHKYYSVNLFAYILLVFSIIIVSAHIAIYWFDNILVALIGEVFYNIIINFVVPLNLLMIFIEFLLHRLGFQVNELKVVLPVKYLIIIYTILVLLFLMNAAYIIYCLMQPPMDLMLD